MLGIRSIKFYSESWLVAFIYFAPLLLIATGLPRLTLCDWVTAMLSTLRIGSEISPLGSEFGGSEYGKDTRSDMEFGSRIGLGAKCRVE